ncbi:chaperonin 10-like protein [Aspergillus avenaceus]|uniref:Chaperonin 10-like protein n=1 Tax=Aspergillus avenaceus TaxID=36643 RepID=A0A5N6TML6_ASPAV|nr:chaperonin 10-like protein [Aspergillus avenaceus]
MRAVRFHGREDVRVEQIAEPVCGEGQVKVYLHEYTSGPMATPQTPHAITGGMIPVTLGHEFSGVIEEVGEGVRRVKVGDAVAVRTHLYDGSCVCCVNGRRNCCRNMGFISLVGDAGGLAEYVVVGEDRAVLLPGGVALDVGALVEPLSVAWHAVKRGFVGAVRTALVVGGGPIGLAVVQVLRARGVESVLVAEVSPERRRLARAFGATDVVDPGAEDVVAKAVIDAICSGALNPRPMITSRIRLEEIVEKGFKALINERDRHVKILIDLSV